MRRLIIDIGTNSVLGLLAEISGKDLKVISDYQKTTRLGERLQETGNLGNEGVKRTADAIKSLLDRGGYDSALLIATEALRKAGNSQEFIRRIFESTGQEVMVISGEKEAELSYFGALFDLDIPRAPILVMDIGGGSTELASGSMGKIESRLSLSLGAARLRRSVESDSLVDYTRAAGRILKDNLDKFDAPNIGNLVATGGTITSLAALARGLKKYDPAAIHGTSLSVKEINEIALGFENSKNRKSLIPFDPERADLILPGAGIFSALLGILSRDDLIVSTGGLRFGAALYPQLLDK